MHSIIAGKTTNISERFILSNEGMTWDEGQSYCRQHYTDMASVRNLAESRKIGSIVPKGNWRGSACSETGAGRTRVTLHSDFGIQEHPIIATGTVSVIGKSGKWADYTCGTKLPFCCYSGELHDTVCVSLA